MMGKLLMEIRSKARSSNKIIPMAFQVEGEGDIAEIGVCVVIRIVVDGKSQFNQL